MSTVIRLFVCLFIPILVHCRRDDLPAESSSASAMPSAPQTNRIDVPIAVRRNLGISFVRVERRAVQRTLRAPGRFELQPEATREYRSMMRGRIEWQVRPFDAVEEGTILYTLDSPQWRELQQRLSEAEMQVRLGQARLESIGPLLEAHERHHVALQEATDLWASRLSQLEMAGESGAVSADTLTRVRTSLAASRALLAETLEKEAELVTRKAITAIELAEASERFSLLLASAAAALGVSVGDLEMVDPSSRQLRTRWRELELISIRAQSPGVVETFGVTNGGWVEEGGLVVTTVQPGRLQFHARGLQSDLPRLRNGLAARITPVAGDRLYAPGTMEGVLRIGLAAEPQSRTIDLWVVPSVLVDWALPGLVATLEITLDGDAANELAIPLAATIRDGLETVIFRRDPANPDRVIRLVADLGANDGTWVEILSGVKEGDEVVLDGIYQLMLATAGNVSRGGHFHADGTWHDEDH